MERKRSNKRDSYFQTSQKKTREKRASVFRSQKFSVVREPVDFLKNCADERQGSLVPDTASVIARCHLHAVAILLQLTKVFPFLGWYMKLQRVPGAV